MMTLRFHTKILCTYVECNDTKLLKSYEIRRRDAMARMLFKTTAMRSSNINFKDHIHGLSK